MCIYRSLRVRGKVRNGESRASKMNEWGTKYSFPKLSLEETGGSGLTPISLAPSLEKPTLLSRGA